MNRTHRGIGVAGLVVLAYAVLYALPVTGDFLARNAPVAVVVLGVVYGTVTALGAMALILTYRSNHFVNFAYGAMGSVVGMLSIGMYLEHGMSYWIAMPLGVLGGAALGAGVERFVLRRFQSASRLVLTVASIGLAQVLAGLEILGTKRIGFVSLHGAFAAPFDLSLDLGVKKLGGDEMLIVFVAPLVLVALAWFLTRTDTGVAVRAAAENVERALVLGIPVRRNTTIVWAIAGALATLTFVLKAPFSGVAPGVAATGPSVLLPALAAAVVARMESLPVALGAGIGLGVLEQVARWNTSGSPSFVDALFLVVIVVALLAQRRQLSRGQDTGASSWSASGVVRPIPVALRTLPEVRLALGAAVVVVLLLAVTLPASWSADDQLLAAFALTWAMVAVSLVVLTGWGGNISLGQFGFVGAAAMVAGNLIADHNVDLVFVMIGAALAGAGLALLVGLPALRIQGLFLAVTTIAFAVALDSYVLNVNNFPELVPSDVPRPLLFGRFDLEDQYTMYLLCLAVLAMWIVVAAGLRKARTGRTLMATRDNERGAAAAGVSPSRTKLSGFLLAGAIAGVAGALHVQLLHSLSPGSYPVNDSITVFAMSVIGGLGSVPGAVGGVLLYKWLETIQALGDVRLILTGAGLLLVLYALPGGLSQLAVRGRDRLLARVADRRGIVLAAPSADGVVGVEEAHATAERTPDDPALDRPAAMLSCRDIDLGYGSLQIIFDLDLEVHRGEMVALLGTNGAGKSTLLKGISGLLPPSAGTIALGGQAVSGEAADRIAARGLSLLSGGHAVFPTLTVAENLRLAAWMFRHDRARVERARQEAEALFPVLSDRRTQLAGDLSGGEQQMLGLAGSLMTEPDVLLIDELSLGLAPAVVGQLLEVVRDVHRRGTTVVVVEQSVNVALELAARAVFMEKGTIRFEGPTAELLERPDLLRSVFIEGGGGRGPVAEPTVAVDPVRALPVLECRGLAKRFGGVVAVDDVDLTVGPGEIVGLIGHNGAGKTTLLDCISGFLELDRGTIRLRTDDLTLRTPAERSRLGLGRSFQDARLFPSLTVAETISVARERHLTNRSMLADGLQLPASFESEIRVDEKVDELLELMGLTALQEHLTGELSTGTRRIVDLACTLAHEPAVVLLDEPSSGVAQRETEALGELLRQVRRETGCAMVVIEHDMPLLRSLADRMLALELGAVIAEGSPDEVLRHPRVIESYLGTDEATIQRSGARTGKRPAPRRPAAKKAAPKQAVAKQVAAPRAPARKTPAKRT